MVSMQLPVVTSQTFTFSYPSLGQNSRSKSIRPLYSFDEAIYLPSGDQAMVTTVSRCPLKSCNLFPAAASSTHTWLSVPPEAIYLPSGDHARELTQVWLPS